MSNPIRFGGLEIRFLHDGASTAGGLDMFEMTVQPQARMPVPHHHESWDEVAYGLEGVTTFTVGGQEHALGVGQSVFIRRGVVHGFRNGGPAVSRCLCTLTPGVLGPGYFQEMAALLAAGAGPAAMQALMLRHGLVPAP